MTDQREARMRALVVELVESAPPAPPFPTAELVAASPARRPLVRPVLAAVVVIALLAVAIGAVALFGRDGDDKKPPVVTPSPTTGRAIAYVDDTGLWVLPAEGAGPEPFFLFGVGGALRPRWSPDGKYLAFQHDDFVLMMPVTFDGEREGRPIPDRAEHWDWSPSSNVIAAVVDDGTQRDVVVYAANGKRIARYSGATDFAWTPGGSLFVVRRASAATELPRDGLFRAAPGDWDLQPIAVEVSDTDDYGLVLGPVSPDGDLALWIDTAYGSGSVLMDRPPIAVVHDGQAIELGNMFLQRSWAQWSRDGRLAYVETDGRMVTDERTLKLCIVGVQCRPVLDDGSQTMEPAFSPDGQRLAFVRNEAAEGYPDFITNGARDWRPLYDERQLWVANSDGSGPFHVTGAGEGVGAPTWVSDTRILYTNTQGELRVYDVTTDKSQKVAQLATDMDLPPAQVYDPTDANGELQWTDLFAVAPAPSATPEPVTNVGERFTFEGRDNEAVFDGAGSGLSYQAGGCLGTACNPYGVSFVANTPVDKGAGMQGYLWLTKVVGGAGGANPLTEVVREVAIDVPVGLAPAVDCHRDGDTEHNVFALVHPSNVDGAVEPVTRAWWTDGPGERIEAIDPSTVECRVVID